MRVPAKSCPQLFSLIQSISPELLTAFLKAKPFEKFGWLKGYFPALGDVPNNEPTLRMLDRETKQRLLPLETEAARIVTIAGARGQFVLREMARSKLSIDRFGQLIGQVDELTRSLWAYLNEAGLFEATENSLHMRLYRRYDRHYQTFQAEPSAGIDPERETAALSELLSALCDSLKLGDGYQIQRFELPEDGEEPASVMYLLTHPKPTTSVRDLDDNGNSSRIYFRPPGEAMIVYTPSRGAVHVRAESRVLRHQIAEEFVRKALEQEPSRQPIDFQAYDISKFITSVDLEKPTFEDVEIKDAKVIRLEVSVGDLVSRLAVSTSITGNLYQVMKRQPGLDRIIQNAIAVRLVEIAVRYRLKDRDDIRTLDFTITDRNTCSLLSVDDPFERVLGHRLLRRWEILREGRAPSEADSMRALPALLDLWDIGSETVSGAWLRSRNVDVALLVDIGFLVPAGQEGDDLLETMDDDDGLGAMEAEAVTRTSGVGLRIATGVELPGSTADRYRVYRVRVGWVDQHLKAVVASRLTGSIPQDLSGDLVLLGTFKILERDVPVYLARGLSEEKTRTETDTTLRTRKGNGVGLVLQAGCAPGACLGENVLLRLSDHLSGTLPDIALDLHGIADAYLRCNHLAQGGDDVKFEKTGVAFGTLFVPKKGSIDISGANRVLVIDRLVQAHHDQLTPIASDKLRAGFEDQSFANIFGQPLWDKLKADFVRSPKRPLWEIAV